jgi:VIT1/CCC1 family predicted Fe2+/Mn2+ transporter
VLDPVQRSSEVLFGLIMVLSFTCSISAATAGREEVREVVGGAIGCNLAWGIVDAIMYLMAIVLERGRGLTIGRAVQSSRDAAHGRRLVADSLPDRLGEMFDEDALERARAKIAAIPQLPLRPRLAWRDFQGALGVFLLVFLSTFPVVVPFLLSGPLQRNMRISNAVAIFLLYVAGHLLGRYAGLRPVRTGLAMVVVGVVLVGITIALGG